MQTYGHIRVDAARCRPRSLAGVSTTRMHRAAPVAATAGRDCRHANGSVLSSTGTSSFPSTNARCRSQDHTESLPRRSVLQTVFLTALAGPALADSGTPQALPEATKPEAATWVRYVDDTDRFTITLPPGWVGGEGGIDGNNSFSGASGLRRVVAWFPDPETLRDTNVTLVITNVGADFTQMGSFGNAYAFASNLVGSMDQSYLKRAPAWSRPQGPIQEADLVDARARGRFYEIEYTVAKEPEPKRHLLSSVTIGYNGRYNRLYTLTAQSTEDKWPAVQAAAKKMLASFQPPVVTD